MKNYSVTELIAEVKVCMDRNAQDTTLVDVGDIDTLQQKDIIRSKLVDAATLVESDAPLSMLSGKGWGTGVLSDRECVKVDNSLYVYRIKLPSDTLRLIRIKLKSWSRAARIVDENEEEALLQTSHIRGVMGDPERPVAVVQQGPDGELEVMLYSSEVGGSTKEDYDPIETGTYLPLPKIENEGQETIALPEKLKSAVVYMTGYLACMTLGDTQTASALLSVAQSLTGNKTTIRPNNTNNEEEQ